MIYSKVYETGTSEYETEKMIKFIQSIKSPSIIMMVAQAEAFGQMTDEAWAIFVSIFDLVTAVPIIAFCKYYF